MRLDLNVRMCLDTCTDTVLTRAMTTSQELAERMTGKSDAELHACVKLASNRPQLAKAARAELRRRTRKLGQHHPDYWR